MLRFVLPQRHHRGAYRVVVRRALPEENIRDLHKVIYMVRPGAFKEERQVFIRSFSGLLSPLFSSFHPEAFFFFFCHLFIYPSYLFIHTCCVQDDALQGGELYAIHNLNKLKSQEEFYSQYRPVQNQKLPLNKTPDGHTYDSTWTTLCPSGRMPHLGRA